MAKFAVYTIPPAESLMYQRGSEILGYDVRRGLFLPNDNPTRDALPEFDPAWVAQPRTYGFHVTTGYSLYCDPAVLPNIEQAMEDTVKLFSPGLPFTFTPIQERVTFWHDEIVVLRYDPNPNLLMLHAMLIARVNPFATGSNVSESYAKQDPATLNPTNVERVRQYYTPYMLDGWTPHFTLMMPYTGTQPDAMRAALLNLFDDAPVPVESICLLVKGDGESHYRLHREYPLF